MKDLTKVILLLILVVSCTTQKNNRLTAEVIIEKAIESYGGESKLRTIKSRNEKGVTLIFIKDSLYRSNQYISLKKEGGKHYYQSPAHQKKYGQKLVFASNGSYSWTQNDGALAPYLQPQNEHINKKGEDYPYFFNLKERGIKIKYIETVVEHKEKLHRVDYVNDAGITEEVYFTDGSWLIRKTHRFIETSQGRAEMIRYFQDYRNVADVMIPFRSESHFPPREININLLKTLSINEHILDDVFELPKPKLLTSSEINQFTGTYHNKGKALKIIEQDSKLFMQYDNQAKIELLIVDENLLMYRNGLVDGSRMANIIRKNIEGKPFIEICLRKQTTEWAKR